ncbi:MAG: quinone oxidoreductase [Micromonosporaceae bacterium]|nr:quinone oxidoreductase [Micromonosporaceae bacterium]
MHAILVTERGGPEVLRLSDVETPRPGPGQVLVRLAATGVNFIDTYHRSGLYEVPLPFTPGSEAAGEVTEVGEGVTELRPGDRVASTNFTGAYAEYALVPAARAVPVPDGVTDEQAAGVLLQGMTAHYLLHNSYPLRPGDTVLVHAAAGGMGLLLTQLATALGGKVIATVSTPEKENLARDAGAVAVLRYADVPAKVRELTGGDGVHAVYDGVGADTFDGSLASLRTRGTLVLYGYASGKVPPFDINRLQGGSWSLTRPTLGHFIATREELTLRARDILDRVAAGTLEVRVGTRYPLAEAAKAHQDLQSRRTTGKLLLIP